MGREEVGAGRWLLRTRHLALSLAVFTPPHHKGDKEGDKADGGNDHRQENVLRRV